MFPDLMREQTAESDGLRERSSWEESGEINVEKPISRPSVDEGLEGRIRNESSETLG